MPHQNFQAFREARAAAQARLEATTHLGVRRFLALDSGAYRDGVAPSASGEGGGGLPADVKELLGLVASFVLRCDDCINYHLEQCVRAGYTARQIEDAMNVGLVVGGSITIPHMRRALLMLDELLAEQAKAKS